MHENELSNNSELGFDELDLVAGGSGSANAIEVEGQVTEAFPNAIFQVQLDNGNSARCHLSGQLRMNYIRVVPGNRVRVQLDAGDPSKGRIVYRYK